jgi:hypothetical protein
MRRILSDGLVGAMAGFIVGFFGYIAVNDVVVPLPGIPGMGPLVGALAGAVCGGIVGSYLRRPVEEGGSIARWCASMTVVVGGVSFLAGFVGPILLQPDMPQGPLLGIFCTGPLGALAGAALGALLGLARQTLRHEPPHPAGRQV